MSFVSLAQSVAGRARLAGATRTPVCHARIRHDDLDVDLADLATVNGKHAQIVRRRTQDAPMSGAFTALMFGLALGGAVRDGGGHPHEGEAVRPAPLLPQEAATERQVCNGAELDEHRRLVGRLGGSCVFGESHHGGRVATSPRGGYPPKVGFFSRTRDTKGPLPKPQRRKRGLPSRARNPTRTRSGLGTAGR
jgi:hypothetical protein